MLRPSRNFQAGRSLRFQPVDAKELDSLGAGERSRPGDSKLRRQEPTGHKFTMRVGGSVATMMIAIKSSTSEALAATQVIVLKRNGKWHVKWWDSERLFADEVSAVTGAIDLAHASGKNGTPACVVLLDGDKAKVIWTYGQDPLPSITRKSKHKKPARLVP